MYINEQLLAALTIARGCLDGHTSYDVWDVVEEAIAKAKKSGLGKDISIFSPKVQELLKIEEAEYQENQKLNA